MYPRLEEEMKRRQMDTESLAELLDLTWWRAYHRRNGQTPFTPLERRVLSIEMGVPADELLKEE